MEHQKRKVDLVRVEREEQVFEREAVLGRDVESVFPTELKQEDVDTTDAVKEAIGSVKFITENEVEEIKSKRKDKDGNAVASSKPLAQILSERREQKNEEFQEKWKTMKTGKNRPLDADEVEFLESVEAKRRKVEEGRRAEEEAQVLAFQLAREQVVQKSSKVSNFGLGDPLTSLKKKKSIIGTKFAVRPKATIIAKPKEESAPKPQGLAGLVAYDSSSED